MSRPRGQPPRAIRPARIHAMTTLARRYWSRRCRARSSRTDRQTVLRDGLDLVGPRPAINSRSEWCGGDQDVPHGSSPSATDGELGSSCSARLPTSPSTACCHAISLVRPAQSVRARAVAAQRAGTRLVECACRIVGTPPKEDVGTGAINAIARRSTTTSVSGALAVEGDRLCREPAPRRRRRRSGRQPACAGPPPGPRSPRSAHSARARSPAPPADRPAGEVPSVHGTEVGLGPARGRRPGVWSLRRPQVEGAAPVHRGLAPAKRASAAWAARIRHSARGSRPQRPPGAWRPHRARRPAGRPAPARAADGSRVPPRRRAVAAQPPRTEDVPAASVPPSDASRRSRRSASSRRPWASPGPCRSATVITTSSGGARSPTPSR